MWNKKVDRSRRGFHGFGERGPWRRATGGQQHLPQGGLRPPPRDRMEHFERKQQLEKYGGRSFLRSATLSQTTASSNSTGVLWCFLWDEIGFVDVIGIFLDRRSPHAVREASDRPVHDADDSENGAILNPAFFHCDHRRHVEGISNSGWPDGGTAGRRDGRT